MNNLNSIFNSILPENLKNTSAINDYVEIFIELLEEHCKVSLETIHFFDDNITNKTKEELVKIYLYDYYSMIERLKSDYSIINRFRRENQILRPYLYEDDSLDARFSNSTVIDYFNIGGTIISSSFSGPEFDSILASEVNVNPIYSKIDNLQNAMLRVKPDNFYFNRLFKETKGFISSIKFIYDCLNKYLIPEDEQLPVSITEMGVPFKLRIRGSVDREIYRAGVEYLTHPLGFVYLYDQIKQIRFEDYFSVKFAYKNSKVEVRCLSGNSEIYDKPISQVIKYNGLIKVIFDDKSLLVQENGEIKYYNSANRLQKKYPISNNCSIYLSYELVFEQTISDSARFKIKSKLPYDNVIVKDNLKSTLIYTPKIGLVIGRFFLGVGERFYKDNNIYSFKTQDTFEIKNFLGLKTKDNFIVSDLNKFKFYNKPIIDINVISDKITYNKDTTSIKEQIEINENEKFSFNQKLDDEEYEATVFEKFNFEIPLSQIDDEGQNLNEIINITPLNTFNGIQETLKYSENISEMITSKFKENYEVSEYSKSYAKFKLHDANSYSVEIKSSLEHKIPNDVFQHVITDRFGFLSELTTEDNFLKPRDSTFLIFSNHKLSDKLEYVDDKIEFVQQMRFNIGKMIGDGNVIGDGSLISDTDVNEYYKYKENMDII